VNILAIDSGNTRIKWGLWGGGEKGAWVRVGAMVHDEARDRDTGIAAAFAEAFSNHSAPAIIAIANVAGEGVRSLLEGAFASQTSALAKAPIWARSEAAQCGVINRYFEPATLGVDRWAALIGARHRLKQAGLVVCAGTATTADLLSASGEFRGGIILPGLDMMKRALAQHTARLPLADGAYFEEPRSTADAIETGALHAQAGAIERMYARAGARGETGAAPICLLSGGAASRIAECLSIPHQVRDHLVLDGLVRIALEAAP
jgi:type III pantothenate kinase